MPYTYSMKRTILFLAVLLTAATVFAERITFTTGDLAGTSITDRFMPVDFTMISAPYTVNAIRKAEDGLWCIKLTAAKVVNIEWNKAELEVE